MARQDWYDRDEEARRLARLRDRDEARDDFGQADYSRRYGYDADSRRGYRVERDRRGDVYDFGQADYSNDYAYDEANRRAHRRTDGAPYDRYEGARYGGDRYDGRDEPRSWTERAQDFFTGHRHDHDRDYERDQDRDPRRLSDRDLREVIVRRLARERGLDLNDVDLIVEDREVTLNGRVRTKADKRRVEDIADIDGVRHVQNNLRAREHSHWTFL